MPVVPPCLQFVASYQGRLTGWASGGSWDPLACPQHAEAGYQWLAFAGNITQSSSIFEAAPEYGGAIRVLRAGTVAGSVSVHWDGHTTEWSKYLIVGESTLQPGELPSPHDSCLLPASACGACLDGFNFADCSCDEGATEVTFSHVVEAGKLLQVAAIPNQFVGADEGTLRGSLFVSFAPGGYCDFTQGEGGGSDGCVSPWDGVWLGENGCIVEGATQALDDEEHALELATQARPSPPAPTAARPRAPRTLTRAARARRRAATSPRSPTTRPSSTATSTTAATSLPPSRSEHGFTPCRPRRIAPSPHLPHAPSTPPAPRRRRATRARSSSTAAGCW